MILGENRKESRQVKFRVSDDGERMKPSRIDREGAFEITRELCSIGVNVNQIARRLNQGQNVPMEQLEGLERQLIDWFCFFCSKKEKNASIN